MIHALKIIGALLCGAGLLLLIYVKPVNQCPKRAPHNRWTTTTGTAAIGVN
jgi:hypothetical protein